jgi:hypothetical protein
MTREQHLSFCKVCKNKKFDPRLGIICGLTGAIANFENECTTYEYNKEDALKQLGEALHFAGGSTLAGDPVDGNKNKTLGGIWFFGGILLTLITFALIDELGFGIISTGAILNGIRLYDKGVQQERIYAEYLEREERINQNDDQDQ